MKRILIVSLLLFAPVLLAQNAIPSGTILPVKLNSSLNSKKNKPGERITGSLAQDVPLASGSKLRAGSKVAGHVIAVTPATGGAGAKISFQFDTLQRASGAIPLTSYLRAVASMMEVEEAQVPTTGPDSGTSEADWVTEQIGGETNNHGGGPVTHNSQVVGHSLFGGGVLSRVGTRPGTKCLGEIDGNDQPQAFWLFASDACGTYGFADLSIAHAGRTEPLGQIVLTSEKGEIKIRSGAGLLLREQ